MKIELMNGQMDSHHFLHSLIGHIRTATRVWVREANSHSSFSTWCKTEMDGWISNFAMINALICDCSFKLTQIKLEDG